MRLTLALIAAGLAMSALSGCNSTDSGPGGSGLSESFNPDNYRRSSNTNGTQTRPDVNRQFTQPTLPTISNRGF